MVLFYKQCVSFVCMANGCTCRLQTVYLFLLFVCAAAFLNRNLNFLGQFVDMGSFGGLILVVLGCNQVKKNTCGRF